MRWIRKPAAWLAALLTSICFLFIGSAAFMTFISLRMVSLGYSAWSLGVVHSAFYLGLMLGVQAGERVIAAVGHIRAFSGFAAIFGGTIVVMETSESAVLWVIMRAAAGFSLGSLYLVLESWFIGVSQISNRGSVLSLYTLFLFLSQAAGQGVLLAIDTTTNSGFNISALFCLLAISPIAMVRMEGPIVQLERPLSFGQVLKHSKIACLGSLSAGVLVSALYSFVPVWAKSVGLLPPIAMAAVIVGGTVCLWPLGHLSDKADRRLVLMAIVVAISSLGLVAPQLLKQNPEGLYLALSLVGGLGFALYPISVSHALDRLPCSSQLRVTSLMLILYGVGACIGPIYTSVWLEAFPVKGLLYGMASIALPLVFFIPYALTQTEPVPEDERGEYRPLPRTTPIATQIDEQ